MPNRRTARAAAALTAVLGGCALAPHGQDASAPVEGAALSYRCEQGATFAVRFAGDSAVVQPTGSGQREVLLRDAGGLTPQHTVWANARLRAEFGLGAGGREALLHDLARSQTTRCTRD